MQTSLSAARQEIHECLGRGDADAALERIARIRERFPEDYRLHLLRGRALLAKGDLEAARSELEGAAAITPEDRDVQLGLASCGVEAAKQIAAELPPLQPADGERAPISAVALGHLYLRQFLLTHCTSQLDPIWQARRERPDVGAALAEAHWRLEEAEPAADICRALLEGHPDCLKANLIYAQMLLVSGQNEAAQQLVARAQELDPENELAEDLYEWLIVRDPSLVPLRRRAVMVDVPEPVVQPASETVEEPEPELTAEAEPVLEPEPELTAEAEPVLEPEPERAGDLEPEIEPLASEERSPAFEAVLAEAPIEPPAESPAPFWELAEAPSPAGGGEVEVEGTQGLAQQVAPASEALSEPDIAATDLVSEPDVTETAPEPALAVAEAEAGGLESQSFEWLEVDHRGQLGSRGPLTDAMADAHNRCVGEWIASFGAFGGRLSLGALRASSIDSDHGALQALHHERRTVVALAPAGANLGLVRARLRQTLEPSKEHITD